MKLLQAIVIMSLLLAVFKADAAGAGQHEKSTTYYVDSEKGNDESNGQSEMQAWQSLKKVEAAKLNPGDEVRFRKGSMFTGPLYIRYSGTAGQPILVSDYGDSTASAPIFTNPVFTQDNYGNCIRLQGSHIILENLHCQYTAAYRAGPYTIQRPKWDTIVWEMGAIFIDKQAEYCIVRNNEVEDCSVGIKSYGQHALITHNFIHDCNRVLKEWGWGPIGIWFGGDYQEASYNRVFNYRAENKRIGWHGGSGGGADGGAFEIDDARYNKSHISIHHNYTRDCQGFLEVTWTDIAQMPVYKDFSIHHNISDDYQQFVALWDSREAEIFNNTIIRRKKNVNDWGVFNIANDNSQNHVHHNIIITEQDIQIFNAGLRAPRHPQTVIDHNLYYAAAGKLVMGVEGPGTDPRYDDPAMRNYKYGSNPRDFISTRTTGSDDRGVPEKELLSFDSIYRPLELATKKN
jgi:hypothetical protein